MKQTITTDDLNQLSGKGKERLIEWKVKHDREQTTKEQIEASTLTEIAMLEGNLISQIGNGKRLCLNIGEMIEFLGEEIWFDRVLNEHTGMIYRGYDGELCDALWSACVEVLNRE